MTARILLAAIAAFFISTARADEPKSVGKQLVSAAEAVTTTGPGFSSDGKAQRIVATGISTATVTVYGTNVYCGKTCSASSTSATSVGTITSSGDSVDNQTYLYYFALVTAYTSGTIDVTMTEQPAGGAGSSSTSPAYVTPVDAGGTSMAVDRSSTPAADVPGFMPWAVRDDALATLAEADGEATPLRVDSQGKLWTSSVNYVSENNTSGTSTNVAATALGVGGAGVELIDGYDLGAIAATYCTLAITNSADGAIDAAKIYLLPSGETNLTAPNVIGGSTGTTSAHFTAPAVGSPLEWATSWVTSTGVIGDGDLTDLAASSVWVGRLKVAGADKLYVEISGDGAVDSSYRLSCN